MSAVREHIDFHEVRPQHYAIHERLQNWARWANNAGGRDVAPGFDLYQSTARAREQLDASAPVERLDAARISKAISHLPELHRKALNWCYLKPVNPSKACRELETTMGGLMQLVHDGRQILVNREV